MSSTPPSPSITPPLAALQFFHTITQLKLLPRQGWLRYGIQQVESVADHMYRMGVMSMCIADATIDRNKLLKICIVHDLAEAVVGDITPYDGVSEMDKRQREEVRNIGI